MPPTHAPYCWGRERPTRSARPCNARRAGLTGKPGAPPKCTLRCARGRPRLTANLALAPMTPTFERKNMTDHIDDEDVSEAHILTTKALAKGRLA